MAGFTDTFENEILDLILRAGAIANIADNAASAPATVLYHSLHTADPTDAGNQTSSETAYTSYARANVARSTGYGAASGGSASPAADIDFAAGTGGGDTVTHFGIGLDLSGTGTLIASGTVTPNIGTGDGVTPRLTTATTITLD